MIILDSLPLLAKGSHASGSGMGCIMNVVSYLNGDQKITDSPDCTHSVLARAAQVVNDLMCTHRDGDILCPECSAKLWPLLPRLFGTASDDKVLSARLAIWCARNVLHLTQDREACDRAIGAAEAWCDDPTKANATAAYATAANATAAYATAAAYAATTAAYAATAATAANAAYATNAATAATNAAAFLAGLLDEYDRLVGRASYRSVTPDEVVGIRELLSVGQNGCRAGMRSGRD